MLKHHVVVAAARVLSLPGSERALVHDALRTAVSDLGGQHGLIRRLLVLTAGQWPVLLLGHTLYHHAFVRPLGLVLIRLLRQLLSVL